MSRGVRIHSTEEYLDAIINALFKLKSAKQSEIAKWAVENNHVITKNQAFNSMKYTISNTLRKYTSDNVEKDGTKRNKNNLPVGHINDVFHYNVNTTKWSIKNLSRLIALVNNISNSEKHEQHDHSEQKRNPLIAKLAKTLANHQCEIDATHQSFPTPEGVMYTEAHHLIPWDKRHLFKSNIDIVENMCVLHSDCHKLIHYGIWDDKVKLLKILYDKKIDGLRKAGFDISFEQLLELYK